MVEPYEVEDTDVKVWPEYTTETWSKHLHKRLDEYVDKKVIVKYHTENVYVENGCPNADVYVIPYKAVETINLSVKVENYASLSEIL